MFVHIWLLDNELVCLASILLIGMNMRSDGFI